MSDVTYSQPGTIEQINDDSIIVRIDCNSACSGCHSKDLCISTDKAVKHITIEPDGNIYSIGQQVTVFSQQKIAFKALFWGHLCPLLIVVASLFALTGIGLSEAKSGLMAISATIPYYMVLFLLRNHFKKKFVFKIKL